MIRISPNLPARAAAVALLAALTAACSRHEPPAPPQPRPIVEGERIRFPMGSPQLASLRSIEVRGGEGEAVRIQGRLVWDETRTTRVDPPVAGRIVRVLAAPGDSVAAGQPLALIASPDVGQAQADARRAEVDLAAATKNLARIRELHEAGVAPARELEAAEAERARAQAERQRAQARRALLGVAGDIDQSFALRAPIGGVVVERSATPGLEVRPDQAQPGQPALFVISDPTRLWARLAIPERLAALVAPGQSVALRPNAAPDRLITARITHVADFIDPATRTLAVRAEVANEDRGLKAEMYLAGELSVPARSVSTVPASALLLSGDRYYAFIDEGEGRYERRPLRAEEGGFGTMRVLEGLAPGERVVVDGVLLLEQLIGARR
ncbi:efflux RND transporter periplasmic adaptor subunit [Burkholderiaceae bacterium FT117]|uniref:efflux RND transporter periplasmic adaptor subunit n=1 Tax=Zeimonas sediminis TaxID=2944268 RepID=UPI002342DD2D|nr:efflux RND transporter periplasmic adaptor subunit [Zeimonas sediminis]MCM5571126.1 efflux RND transporter periplasmic adaptor subunit [Zeimonas sediminis]